jgi:hypothetical protein
MGPQGDQGTPGNSSSVFPYQIDLSGTAAADPGSGKLRFNATPQNTATTMYLSWLTTQGFDAHVLFQAMGVPKNIVLQDTAVASNNQKWTVSGAAVNHTNWFEIPVTYISGSATFTNNQNVSILIVDSGTAGGTAWGQITGTLSQQTDLNTALNNKQNVDADLQSLATNVTPGLWYTAGGGSGAARGIVGTANEIAVADSQGATGNPTISLAPTVNLTSKILRLPNSTTRPAACTMGDAYMDTDATTGQRFYLCEVTNTWVQQGGGGTGLGSDPANCPTGQAAGGITQTGAAEACIDLAANYQQIDGDLISLAAQTGIGLYVHTAPGAVDTRTLVGTPNEITVSDGTGAAANPTISFPSIVNLASKALVLPSSTVLPPVCLVGQIYLDNDAASGAHIYACESANTWVAQAGGTGGPGGGPAFVSAVNVLYAATQTFTVPSNTATDIVFKTTLTGAVTGSTLTGAINGQAIHWIVCQDGSGGRAFTWPSNVVNGAQISASRNSAPGMCVQQSFNFDGTTAYGRKEVVAGGSGGIIINADNEIDIDTAIVPRLGATNTWTGTNTYSGAATYNSTATFNGAATYTGTSTFSGAATYSAATKQDAGYTDVKRVAAPGNPAAGYLRVYADNADGQLKCKDSSGTACITAGTGPGPGAPTATKYTIASTSLAATDSPIVVALAANQVVTKCLAKHSAAFTGPALTSVLVSVGTTTTPDLFCPLLQAGAAPSATTFAADGALGKGTFASDNVIAHFICAGAACSVATAGSLDIYLWIETLP